MANIEKEACEVINQYVRFGFYSATEVTRIVAEDVLDGQLPKKRVRDLVKEEVQKQQAKQASWPAVTGCDRLDRAFAALLKANILAIHNAGYTPSDCITEMSQQYADAGGKKSRIIGYCFYHLQDLQYALKHHSLGLAFGAIDGDTRRGLEVGEQIRATLEAEGLKVLWNGSIDEKMEIPFRWRRRKRPRGYTGY
ncbi:MAG: DUF6891 domain-containing protein [Fimbriiglobus sp.]